MPEPSSLGNHSSFIDSERCRVLNWVTLPIQIVHYMYAVENLTVIDTCQNLPIRESVKGMDSERLYSFHENSIVRALLKQSETGILNYSSLGNHLGIDIVDSKGPFAVTKAIYKRNR
jgi:hypothetical protein